MSSAEKLLVKAPLPLTFAKLKFDTPMEFYSDKSIV